MRCADPAVRAATLLSSAEDATVTALGQAQRCAAVALWGDSLLVLLAPGRVGDVLVGRRSYCRAELGAVQWTASPDGRQARGSLELAGRLRRVPVSAVRSAALQVWETHPREELLDAAAGLGWQLAYLDVTAASWQLSSGVFSLEVADVLAADRDEALRGSLALCEHLNVSHRDLACALAGREAWFAEVDALGVTLGVEGDDFVRVPWPAPCTSQRDVMARLALPKSAVVGSWRSPSR